MYGQPQPGEIILTGGDYVVVDWSEGLAPILVGKQIAELTFYTAVENYEAVTSRVNVLRDALRGRHSVCMKMVCDYWYLWCVNSGKWLTDQRKSIEPMAQYLGYLQQLKAAHNTRSS